MVTVTLAEGARTTRTAPWISRLFRIFLDTTQHDWHRVCASGSEGHRDLRKVTRAVVARQRPNCALSDAVKSAALEKLSEPLVLGDLGFCSDPLVLGDV